jgi:hypothetical protein
MHDFTHGTCSFLHSAPSFACEIVGTCSFRFKKDTVRSRDITGEKSGKDPDSSRWQKAVVSSPIPHFWRAPGQSGRQVLGCGPQFQAWPPKTVLKTVE